MSLASDFFSPCMSDEANATESEICQFAVLLSAIADVLEYWDSSYKGVVGYIRSSVSKGVQMNVTGLRKHFEDHYDFRWLDWYLSMPEDTDSGHYRSLVQVYSLFFPVFKDEAMTEVDELRPLSDFQTPDLPTSVLDPDDTPTFLAYLIDVDLFYHRYHYTIDNKIVANAFFDLMAIFLGVEDVEGVVHAFSYNPYSFPSFGKIVAEGGYLNPCEAEGALKKGDIWKACNDTANQAEACEKYCSWIRNETMRLRAKQLFELGLHPGGSLKPGYPQVLLPACKYPALGGVKSNPDDCWRRVVTDLGVCSSMITG